MNQCRSQVSAHSLSKGERSHRLKHEILQLQHFAQKIHLERKTLLIHLIDISKQCEGFRQRKIPPELCLLPEDHTDVHGILLPVFIGNDAIDMHLP